MKRRGIFLNITITVTIIATFLFGAVIFIRYELKNSKEEIIKLEKEIVVAENQENNFLTIKNILEKTKTDRLKVDKYFIENESEVVLFLEEVEGLGVSYGLSPEVSLGTGSFGADKESLSVDISVEGSFNEVHTYLLLLENFHVKSSFDSLSIRKLSDGVSVGAPQWAMRVRMVIESYVN